MRESNLSEVETKDQRPEVTTQQVQSTVQPDRTPSSQSSSLSLSDKAKLLCFFGKRGSGKTTTIGGQLKDCRPPVVILDVLGNFQKPEFKIFNNISDTIDEINKQVENDRYQIISLQTADPNLSIDFISAALWEVNGGTLILDEVDAFNISDSPCFDQLIRYGRNKNVSIITGCRRPAEVSRNITAAANQLWALKTNEPRDVDYFSATIFGEKSYELMRLPDWHGLFADYDLGEMGVFKIDQSGKIFKLKSEKL